MKTILQRLIRQAGLFVLTCGAAGLVPVAAQEYPSRVIKIVVPAAPGSVTEVIPRIISMKLNERLGWNVIMESKPGGNFIIGHDAVAKAAPDGYTVLMAPSVITLMPFTVKGVPYDLKRDLLPVTRIANVQIVMAVSTTVPVNNLTELIAYSKANPGRLSYGNAGVSGPPRFAMEIIKKATGLDAQFVSYKTGAVIVTDLMSKNLQIGLTGVGNVAEFVKKGQLRAVLIMSPHRSPILPGVPSAADAGFPPSVDGDTWFGFFLPAGTPAAIVNRWQREVSAIVQLPEVKEQFLKLGAVAMFETPPEFAKRIDQELELWGKLTKEMNITPQ